jgi:hypothetical protein
MFAARSATSDLRVLGGHKAVVRPVPIPNTAVKHSIADGSSPIGSARVGSRQFFLKAETNFVSAFLFSTGLILREAQTTTGSRVRRCRVRRANHPGLACRVCPARLAVSVLGRAIFRMIWTVEEPMVFCAKQHRVRLRANIVSCVGASVYGLGDGGGNQVRDDVAGTA